MRRPSPTVNGPRRRPRPIALALILAASLVASVGCGRREPAASREAPARVEPPRPAVTSYRLVGVVRFVDATTGKVTIRHEAIPGFMGAMTMPFTVKDRKSLGEVRAGDEVEGTLRVAREAGEVTDYELTDLAVTRPATGPGFTLNLSGGRAEVQAAPRPLQPGDPVPDFAMTDQDGKPRKLSDLRGKAVALTFIYTRCPLPDFCPRMDRKFSELAGRVSAVPGREKRVRLLSVSFDPEHDTPDVLKTHAATQGARPPLWTFAVAPHDELSKVARPLGLVYGPGKNEVIHNLVIAVIDAGGRLSRVETGDAARSWDMADLLRTLYDASGRPES